jgi:acylaminoacyl-peptidase
MRIQVQAGAGHGVIYLNPRGNQGYGEPSRARWWALGRGDFTDVMAGLVTLRCAPWIDPRRLGVLGGSYGGFLTSWTVGHTDRFRAACSERAVNYHPSMFGTSDIGHLFNEVEIGGLPWEMPEVYAERSPLTASIHPLPSSTRTICCPSAGRAALCPQKRGGARALSRREPRALALG